MRPIHVPNNIAWQPYLLQPCNPLIDVRYQRSENVAVGTDDLAEIREKGIINIVLARCAMPRPVRIL